MLLALLLPFASQAQNSWTVANGTTTHAKVPLDFYNCDGSGVRQAQMLYPASLLTDMAGSSIASITFYHQNTGSKTVTASPWLIKMGTTTLSDLSEGLSSDELTTVYTGNLVVASGVMTFEFSTPYTYSGGNLIVEIYTTGATGNWYGSSNQGCYGEDNVGSTYSTMSSPNYTAFLPKTTFAEAPSCFPVSGLAIDATATTANSLTLTWTDDVNVSATYTVYNGNAEVASGITTNTYTVTGLDANTAYTFGVVADCSGGDLADTATVSGRTACAIIDELPYTMGFEENEIAGTTSTLAFPYCWTRINTLASGTNTYYPYSSTSTAHEGNRKMYFYASSYGTYADTTGFVMPEIDVTTYPMNANRVSFWAKVTSTTNYTVLVGTMSDPEDRGTFTAVDTITVTGTTYTKYSVSLANATATDAYVAFFVPKVNATMYIDDVTLEEMPSCIEVTDLAVSAVTTNSITLTWADASNASATYSVYRITTTGDVIDTVLEEANITGNTYTVTGLNPSTQYTFGVEANCAAGDAALMTVTDRTACGVMSMPFSENFDTWSTKSDCWSFLSGAYNNGAGTPTASTSAWTLNSSYGTYITLSGKALTMNIYSTNRYWAVTPAIAITSDAADLSVDVAVSAWSDATPNYDANDSLVFAITADSGATYTTLAVFDNTALNALGNTYTTLTASALGYNGQTVRFVIFGGSSASGGDNRIVIDNVTVTEGVAPSCLPVTALTVDNVTTESAVLRWTGEAASYHVYTVDEEGDTVLYETTAEDTLLIEDLDAQTSYIFGVASVCGLDESNTSFVTFTTACGAKAIPFTEDFENGIDCWSLVACAASTGIYTDASYVYSGTKCFKFAYNTNPPQYLISPELSNTDDGVSVSFMYRVGSETWTESFKLGYSTTTDDITAFTWGPEQTGLSNLTYEAYSEVMPAGTKYVAIQYTANDKLALYIDSMVFALPPSCLPVAGLTVDSANATSVFLSWTGSATSYTVYDMADSSVVEANVTDTEYEVTGLTDATGYVFGVAANCGSEMSDTVIIAARTACAAFAIPFTENFEATSASFPCWTVISEETSTGLNSGLFLFYYTDEPPQYLISPELSGTAGIDLEVSFDYAAYYATYPESFQVGYSTTTNDVTAFTWSPEVTATNAYSDDGFLRYSVIYSNVTDGIKYVAIKCTSNDQYYLLLDSVVIREAPTCLPVTNLAVDTTSITATSVTINWTGTAASYDVFNGSEFVTNTTSTTYTFTGLTAATNYTIGVMARCSAEDSADMVTINVATACGVISTFPYTQDFADFPACWTTIDADDDGNNWYIYSGTIQSASYANYALYPDNWLVTPQIAIPATSSYEVTWTATAQDQSWPAEHYGVYVSTTGTDTSNFTLLQEWTLSTGVFNPVIDLSDYSGQNIYIALRHFNCTDQFRMSIDDFIVREQAGANQVVINVQQNNPAYGSVTGGGTYTIGDNVTVSATPASGYSFSRWVDTANATISTENPYTFVAATNLTLKAIFLTNSADTYTITVEVNDSTMGTATGGGVYTAGDVVTLSATPYAGYEFVNWTQISGFGENVVSTNASFSTTATGDKTFRANFAADSTVVPPTPVADSLVVNMSVNNATMGTTVPAPGTHIYHIGDTVTAAAVPASGYHLDKWIITLSYMGQTLFGDTLIAIPDPFWLFAEEDVMVMDSMMVGYTFDVEAVFAAGDPLPMNDSVTLITSVNDATMGSIIPAPGTHVYGTDEFVVWSITPNDGYYLANVHFSLAHAMYGVLEDTIVDGAEFLAEMGDTIFFEEMENFYITFEAIFAPQGVQPVYHNVTVRVNDPTMGHVDGIPTTPVLDGATVTLTAVANDGFRFVSWSNGLTTAGITITVTSDTLLVAVFDTMPANPQYYTVTVTYDRTRGNVTLNPDQEQYLEGSSVGLVANAYDRYEFVAWLDENGDTLGTNTAYTITNIQSNRALTAIFAEKQGIDRVDMANVNVFSVEDVIYVRGAEGMNVYLFDVNGRVLNHTANAAESVEFRVAHTGVYLVKVGEAAAKRVVVLR